MKKLLALVLCLCMALPMVACTQSEPAPAPTPTPAEQPAQQPAEEEPQAEAAASPTEYVGNDGGFAVAPLYFYTNKYCLAEGVENVLYTQFGYYFFTYAAGKEDVTACIASEPETIDPGLISSVDGSTYTQHQFEPLMKYVSTGAPVADDPSMLDTKIDYGMASAYEVTENADGTVVYTFTMRDGAKWSDGEPVKAGDFEYAWKRLVNPETASDYGYILDGIVLNAAEIQAGEKAPDELGIKALDDKTLEITLVTACPYFVELCAFSSLMPIRQDVVEAHGAAWTDPANIVVNGPYKATEWVHDSYIKMEKNEHHYDYANLGPNSITWYLSDQETAIISAYQAGEYDFIETFPNDMIAELRQSGDCYINPYVGTYYLYLNCPNIPDWRVRAAISLVIDRVNIVENVTQAGEVEATGLTAAGIKDSAGNNFADKATEDNGIAPMWKWLQENYGEDAGYDLNYYEDRVLLAQDLLAEAEAGGFDKSATIYYRFNTLESHQKIAEAVQSDVNGALGLNMELTNQDWNVYTNGLGEGDFGVARLGWIADYNDPVTYLELFANENSYNYSRWVSDEYTALITEAKSLPAGPERDSIFYEAEELLYAGSK